YRDYARYGDLLKANLRVIEKGQTEVTVVDYFDPAMPELVLPLDPAKSPQGNMDDYFRKHRRYLGAEQQGRARLESQQEALTALEQELSAVEQGQWQPPSEQPVATQRRVRTASP